MSTDRLVTRVYCSKRRNPHLVGRVLLGPEGLLLDYQASMVVGGPPYQRKEWAAIDMTQPLSDKRDLPGATAYCSTCRKLLLMDFRLVRHAAQAGRRSVALETREMREGGFDPHEE